MGIRAWLKSSPPATVASDASATEPAKDTAEHRLAPVDSSPQGCAPVDADADDCSLLGPLGSMRSAREPAEILVAMSGT
jgi:hypothetical protein